jgi:hypothetical protein
VEVKSVTISNEEATQRLQKMITGRETMGIRNFLNEFPSQQNTPFSLSE